MGPRSGERGEPFWGEKRYGNERRFNGAALG